MTRAMSPNAPYAYLLFDLDGTLTDPMEGITRSVQHALRHFGIEITDRRTLTPFIGPPLADSFRDICGLKPEQIPEAIAVMREYFTDRGIFENTPYPGIRETLTRLQAAGYILHIATSKPHLFARRILVHFGLDGFFASVCGAELDGRRQTKAEVIEFLLAEAAIDRPERCLMIGDRRHDTIGAHTAGIDSCGVAWGYGSREELIEAGADYLVASLPELERLLIG